MMQKGGLSFLVQYNNLWISVLEQKRKKACAGFLPTLFISEIPALVTVFSKATLPI